MFGKLSIALLLAASPAAGNPETSQGQTYEVKKVCQTIKEVGSLIPQRTCKTKRVPIRKPDSESLKSDTTNDSAPQPNAH